MVVGVLKIDLRLYGVQSLKQKRSQLRRVLNLLRSGYPVSVAEVACQDLLQRAVLGLSMTAATEAQISSVFNRLEEAVYQAGIVELINTEVEYLHYGEMFN